MSSAVVMSRREAFGWVARAAGGVWVAGCASMTADEGRRFGWEAPPRSRPGLTGQGSGSLPGSTRSPSSWWCS